MNKGLNIFLAILLCVVLYVGLLMSFYSSDKSDSWNPQQGYTMPMGGKSSTSAVSVGGGSTSTGVSVPMRSSSRSMRSSRAVSLYAPAHYSSIAHTQYPIGGTPSNSVASPIYTTSSATMKSFGGGNSAGVSMSGGTVRSDNSVSSVASANIAYASLPATNVPYTYVSTPDENQAVAASVYSGAPAMVNDRYPFSSYSSQIAYNATNTATSLLGNPLGLRGRLKLGIGDANVEDSWLNWLGIMGINVEDVGHYDESTNTWYYDYYDLQKLYQEFCNSWNFGMGKKPTWDEWLAWFMGSEGNPYIWDDGDNQYGFSFVPVGDFMPLIVLALLYVVFIAYRRCQCKMISSNEDVK